MQMKTGADNDAPDNMFQSYTAPELEAYARNTYPSLTTDTAFPEFYWLFEECLRQLKEKTKLSATEWGDFLTKRLGFDRTILALA